MADVVVLADIYAAREKNTYGISSRDILAKLKEKGTECYYFPSFEEIEKFLLKNCINGDLLITMGAGDIVNVGEHLLGRYVINIIHFRLLKTSTIECGFFYILYSGTVAITSVFMNPLFYPHYPHSPQPLILQRLYSKMFFSFFFSYAIICGAANIYTYTFRILSKEGFLHG